MVKTEMDVDDVYRTAGWLPLKNGWPDRAYVRLSDGNLEVKFVEIAGPHDALSPEQELMHVVFRSRRLDVLIEPSSKTPIPPLLSLEQLLKAVEMLHQNRHRKPLP